MLDIDRYELEKLEGKIRNLLKLRETQKTLEREKFLKTSNEFYRFCTWIDTEELGSWGYGNDNDWTENDPYSIEFKYFFIDSYDYIPINVCDSDDLDLIKNIFELNEAQIINLSQAEDYGYELRLYEFYNKEIFQTLEMCKATYNFTEANEIIFELKSAFDSVCFVDEFLNPNISVTDNALCVLSNVDYFSYLHEAWMPLINILKRCKEIKNKLKGEFQINVNNS